ncbi:septum formation initiator family protein [Leifsonia sp. H3M29-4]|uniref:FtsB family cell division protein n=1 Tax=Salinibacterium metalliresistens TaxID=3031321 RepID=UPI0023DAFD5C|nr:septum formation initiator family protein [Salinibacterium metalliresistens]MDF1479440.1 septum formation initiator family protein [Salinibacterium metalliresistens]
MARRTTTKVAARLPEESAPEHWLRNIRFSSFSLLMLGLLILAVIVLAPNLRIFVEQRQQIAALQATVDEAQASVDDLTDDVARWDDPAYIESQARERLFYILPGDISYLVTGDEGIVTTDEGLPISDTIQTTQVDWLRSLLSSVYTSGLTDAPPEKLEGGLQ